MALPSTNSDLGQVTDLFEPPFSYQFNDIQGAVHEIFVHLLSCVQFFTTPWTVVCQASLSFSVSRNLLKLISVDSVIPSNRLILCHPLLLLPSIFPSRVRERQCVLASLGISLTQSNVKDAFLDSQGISLLFQLRFEYGKGNET